MSTFRILSLDGGGIRGAFGAAFLAELEKNVEGSLHEYFDLIVGTSTGGIMALAIAAGLPASDIKLFYSKHGPKIFGSSQRQFAGPWFKAKYKPTALADALDDALGGKRMRDAKTSVVIPAVDLVSGKPTTFKTPHLAEASTRDPDLLMRDVALATTSAPTFFPAANIGEHRAAHVDGGLWANNPAMVAYVEACRMRVASEPFILSVGTGKRAYTLDPPKNDGVAWWGLRAVPTTLDAQAMSAEFMASFVFGERYERANFDIPDKSWALDNVEHLERLMHLGSQEAHKMIHRLKTNFFERKRPTILSRDIMSQPTT